MALDQARETGERFRAAKFDLQKRVLSAYIDYALEAEKIRIGQRNLDLLKLMVDTAQSRAAGLDSNASTPRPTTSRYRMRRRVRART